MTRYPGHGVAYAAPMAETPRCGELSAQYGRGSTGRRSNGAFGTDRSRGVAAGHPARPTVSAVNVPLRMCCNLECGAKFNDKYSMNRDKHMKNEMPCSKCRSGSDGFMLNGVRVRWCFNHHKLHPHFGGSKRFCGAMPSDPAKEAAAPPQPQQSARAKSDADNCVSSTALTWQAGPATAGPCVSPTLDVTPHDDRLRGGTVDWNPIQYLPTAFDGDEYARPTDCLDDGTAFTQVAAATAAPLAQHSPADSHIVNVDAGTTPNKPLFANLPQSFDTIDVGQEAQKAAYFATQT